MSDLRPRAVAANTLGDRLRAALEEEILAGRIAPGEELDERRLAERYAVSRTPVREALLQLASIGLVQMRPRQTAIVTALDPHQLVQMFEVLAGLEAMAAEFAARRMSEDQLRALEQVHARTEQAVAAGNGAAFSELNLAFHRLIYEGAHNAYLAEQARALRLRVAPYRRWLLHKLNRLRRSHQEHGKLLEALKTGDERQAAEVMRRHVQDADRVIDFLMRERANAAPAVEVREPVK